MSDFVVWQKVVYINKNPTVHEHIISGRAKRPEFGKVYTVRSTTDFGDGQSILLVELRNPILSSTIGPIELHFRSTLFKPIVTKKTDISIFKELLNPVNHKEFA